jgi:hypothetical protein
VLEKQKLQSLDGSFDLPPDAKLQVKDLCRLFLSPNVIVPPSRTGYGQLLTSQLITNIKKSSINNERVWGVASSGRVVEGIKIHKGSKHNENSTTANDTNSHTMQYNNYDNNNDNDDCGGDGYDDGGFDYADDLKGLNDSVNINSQQSVDHDRVGLNINSEALLKASRTVEKVEIG